MWKFLWDQTWCDSRKLPETHFTIERAENNRERFELIENWIAIEDQPEMWGRGFYLNQYKREPILSFDNFEEPQKLLELPAWVLNAPKSIPIDKIISEELLSMVAKAAPEKIHDLRAREAEQVRIQKEAKDRERKLNKLAKKTASRVYVIEFENHTCKIGISRNLKQRIATLRGHSGLQIVRWCCSQPLKTASEIENTCHRRFSRSRRYNTEFFNISYEEARNYLESIVPIDFAIDFATELE